MKTRIICDLGGVRGGDEPFPVQLIEDVSTETWYIRAFNEAGFACIDIDFADLVRWILSPSASEFRKHITRHEYGLEDRVVLSSLISRLDAT